MKKMYGLLLMVVFGVLYGMAISAGFSASESWLSQSVALGEFYETGSRHLFNFEIVGIFSYALFLTGVYYLFNEKITRKIEGMSGVMTTSLALSLPIVFTVVIGFMRGIA